ncbi:CLUMA_CG004909, isoform A [Clunio marinus]|uniref:CLUMA_CG004909, isoform A n=1 Tax=Clunio marinus TaxID=568069 RepID=A0A1J1HTA2_9DIPT|nr:CLUMA_CG004909, isoform A [Clunio marinus]
MKLLQGGTFIIFVIVSVCAGNPDAKRLYDDLLSNYNKLVRPVVNVTDALTVRIKLKLSQLIDVVSIKKRSFLSTFFIIIKHCSIVSSILFERYQNLKNQIMTSNLWVEQSWYDYKLKWDPREYGGVEMLHVPSDHIWRPDIVLYNNADGNFEVTLATKATLNYTGRVDWHPPAIYKSSCEIDVEYFPFDEQTCVMKFGSWTYDGFQVDLRHIDELNGTNIVEVGIDLSEFYTSVEWDILEVPAVRNEKFYTCCDEPYLDITFNITMRRKTLFYTVNLIIPCMGISFLTILVFYLPSDSGEKVSLSISILLSLTVFFLLLAEIIPPTSLVVPLLGKFVLFTMILDTFSICVTVIVLNIHFRSPQTHTMAPWVRTIFINNLPKLLVMKRPMYGGLDQYSSASRRFMLRSGTGLELRHDIPPLPPPVSFHGFDPSILLDHHILDPNDRNLETISIGTCRLHGSPKMCPSLNVSPHHRLHHHHHLHLHRSHSRVQSLDLMDDIPLPFQTDQHHLNILVQESPMLSPNPPPSVVESNGQALLSQPLLNIETNTTLASDVTSSVTHQNNNNILSKTNDFNKTSTTTTTNVIINNIKTNTMTIGLTNLESGVIQPQTTKTSTEADAENKTEKTEKTEPNCLRNRWHTCPELHKAMDGVTYIADHTKKEEESTRVKEDWKYVAMVLDRLFLWIFTIAVVVGTAGIILQAPTLYDSRMPIDVKMSEIAATTQITRHARPVL